MRIVVGRTRVQPIRSARLTRNTAGGSGRMASAGGTRVARRIAPTVATIAVPIAISTATATTSAGKRNGETGNRSERRVPAGAERAEPSAHARPRPPRPRA